MCLKRTYEWEGLKEWIVYPIYQASIEVDKSNGRVQNCNPERHGEMIDSQIDPVLLLARMTFGFRKKVAVSSFLAEPLSTVCKYIVSIRLRHEKEHQHEGKPWDYQSLPESPSPAIKRNCEASHYWAKRRTSISEEGPGAESVWDLVEWIYVCCRCRSSGEDRATEDYRWYKVSQSSPSSNWEMRTALKKSYDNNAWEIWYAWSDSRHDDEDTKRSHIWKITSDQGHFR